MEQGFKDQVILITGGGSGIGLVVAQAFVRKGARVIIIGRNFKKLQKAIKKLGGYSHLDFFVCSVEDINQTKSLVKKIKNKYGRIDVLVNCAGVYGPIGPFDENNLQEWQNAVKINLFGSVNMIHAVLPVMLKAKMGKIINLSGGGAVQPFPNFSSYATSKAAIVRFTENLAKEFERKNIQINSIAPGAVNTLFLEKALKAGEKKVGKDFYKKSLQQKKTGGDSADIAAELIIFLAQKENKLTGKLVSAKWDFWQKFDKKIISRLNASGELTLRRIDNKYFKSI